MGSKNVSYHSKNYHVIQATLVALPIYFLLIGVVIVIGWTLKMPTLGMICWVLICTIPFAFQKKFKKSFTKSVDLEFTDEFVLIKEYSINNETDSKEMTIRWEDILSYKFSFSTTNLTYLTISLNDGSTKRFSFKDEKDQIHSVNELSIFSLFFYYISQFNQANESVKKIIMKPGFLTGKRGGLVIRSLVILDVIAITIHFILNPGTAMFSLMSTFIILGLIVKRKTDTAFYNKMMQSVPRAPLFDQR